MKVRAAALALGGRNRTGGSASAPLLERSVCSRPSEPTTYSGSTPPNGTAVAAGLPRPGALPGAAVGGAAGAAPPRACCAAICARIAAPLPGSPTALPLRPPRAPPPPPAKADGASVVRRLGVATSPPGQVEELGGGPPVSAE